MCDPHRGRNFHAVVHDLFRACNAELIDAAVYLAALPHDLIDLFSINSNFLCRRGRGGRCERRFAQGERIVNRLRDLYGFTHRVNVHVHHARRFV